MASYPDDPRELLVKRLEWLLAGDFSAIYRSYHPQSNFRRHFPREDDYLRFSSEQRLDMLRVEEHRVLDETRRGGVAKLLSFQTLRVDTQKSEFYLEVTSLRSSGGKWQVLATKRLHCVQRPDLQKADWDAVEKHPDAIEL